MAGGENEYNKHSFMVDLRGELKQKRRLSPHRVADVLREVCAALEAAHERGLTHRDIKPENIFLARSGGIEVTKVLDFGVAKFVAGAPAPSVTATGTGHLVGTLRYMSPEQLRGEAAAHNWDLWALAVVAYEMLTGGYPFEGLTTPEWHASVIAGRFVPLSRFLLPVPPGWQAFFEKVLAADTSMRPATASEFATKLDSLIVDQ